MNVGELAAAAAVALGSCLADAAVNNHVNKLSLGALHNTTLPDRLQAVYHWLSCLRS
jgi:hypothetical protein